MQINKYFFNVKPPIKFYISVFTNYYKYVDLRVKDEIFKDLEIILSPWVYKTLLPKIKSITQLSQLKNTLGYPCLQAINLIN